MTQLWYKRFLFAVLYAAEGAPIGFVWWTLPIELKSSGVSVGTITTITSLAALPWAGKFIWAPLVDNIRSRLGTDVPLLFTAQIAVALSLLPLTWFNVSAHIGLLCAVVTIHAFCAATHDVVIDGLAVTVSRHAERGRLNGWMQTGMLTGRWVFGAGFLLVASKVDFDWVVYCLCVWTLSSGFIGYSLIKYLNLKPSASANRIRILHTLRKLFSSRPFWIGCAVALTAGAGFESVGLLAGPYLLELGFSKNAIGQFFSASVMAMIFGALSGGWLADRIGHRNILAVATVFIFFMVCGLFFVSTFSPNHTSIIVLMTLIYIATGALTSSSYALFMDLTSPAVASTQFSAFMAFTNLCETWSGYLSGQLAERLHFTTGFLFTASISLFALYFIYHSKFQAVWSPSAGRFTP